MSISTAVIEKLFDAQDHLNTSFDKDNGADWAGAGHPYLDYIWVECGELVGHHGQLFHYKALTEDREQVIIELVDILHFGISVALVKGEEPRHWQHQINAAEDYKSDRDFIDYVRDVAKGSLKGNKFDVFAFARALQTYGLSFEEISELYFTKYALNKFRIDNGVIEGTYNKIWNGQEDNVYLEQISQSIPSGVNLVDYIYGELKAIYATL